MIFSRSYRCQKKKVLTFLQAMLFASAHLDTDPKKIEPLLESSKKYTQEFYLYDLSSSS